MRHFSRAASSESAASPGVACPASKATKIKHPERREAFKTPKNLIERKCNSDGMKKPPDEVEGSQFGNINNFPEQHHDVLHPRRRWRAFGYRPQRENVRPLPSGTLLLAQPALVWPLPTSRQSAK